MSELEKEELDGYIEGVAGEFGLTDHELARIYPEIREKFEGQFDFIEIVSQVSGESGQTMLIFGIHENKPWYWDNDNERWIGIEEEEVE